MSSYRSMVWKCTYLSTYVVNEHCYVPRSRHAPPRIPLLSTVVDCGTLSSPERGQVSHTGRTTFGQTATYSCDTGYNLVGSSTRTCLAIGVWSGSASMCQRKLLLSDIHVCMYKMSGNPTLHSSHICIHATCTTSTLYKDLIHIVNTNI